MNKNQFIALNQKSVIRLTFISYSILLLYSLTILRDREAYLDFWEWRKGVYSNGDSYLENRNYYDFSLPQEVRNLVLETEEWKQISEEEDRRIRIRGHILGLANLFEYPEIFDNKSGKDDEGVNLRELVFLLIVIALYVFSNTRISGIRDGVLNSNYRYSAIVNNQIDRYKYFCIIPFLQENLLARWKYKSDITMQLFNIYQAGRNNIISAEEAQAKMSRLKKEDQLKEAEYYFDYDQDYLNLKRAAKENVISSFDFLQKESIMKEKFLAQLE
jgi:hypothetical protein